MKTSVPKDIVMRYFNLPGRGEPSRLALKLANIPFTDERISNWKDIKHTVQPWGSLPVLVADGVEVFQSLNIHLYVGSFTGFIPEQLQDELKMRECMFAIEDVLATFAPSSTLSDPAEKAAARAALCVPGGKLFDNLHKFELFLGDKQYVAGNKLSMGDLCFFTLLGTLTCGLFDGVPTTLLEGLPVLKQYFHNIANREDVRAVYEAETAPWGKAFLV